MSIYSHRFCFCCASSFICKIGTAKSGVGISSMEGGVGIVTCNLETPINGFAVQPFAVGDEIRKSLIAPWKLPILPFSLPKRIFAHRKTISRLRLEEAIADCLFIFDLEKNIVKVTEVKIPYLEELVWYELHIFHKFTTLFFFFKKRFLDLVPKSILVTPSNKSTKPKKTKKKVKIVEQKFRKTKKSI